MIERGTFSISEVLLEWFKGQGFTPEGICGGCSCEELKSALSTSLDQ